MVGACMSWGSGVMAFRRLFTDSGRRVLVRPEPAARPPRNLTQPWERAAGRRAIGEATLRSAERASLRCRRGAMSQVPAASKHVAARAARASRSARARRSAARSSPAAAPSSPSTRLQTAGRAARRYRADPRSWCCSPAPTGRWSLHRCGDVAEHAAQAVGGDACPGGVAGLEGLFELAQKRRTALGDHGLGLAD